MAAHPIAHLELSATDPAAASRFYADLFGWKIEHNRQFDYYIFEGEGGPRGGFVKPDGTRHKAGEVVVYFGTDDIDATLKKVEALGGRSYCPRRRFLASPGTLFLLTPPATDWGYTPARDSPSSLSENLP